MKVPHVPIVLGMSLASRARAVQHLVPPRGCPERRGRAVAILTLMWLLSGGATGASGQMFVSTGRDTLRGLPGVEVAVEVPEELERDGVTAAIVRAEVVRWLEAKKIPVYRSQTENPSPAKPYLYVHVNALHVLPHALYAIGLQVHLRQSLRSPVTDSTIVNAMSWDAHNVVVLPARELRSVLGEIQLCVDRFIEDWLSVH